MYICFNDNIYVVTLRIDILYGFATYEARAILQNNIIEAETLVFPESIFIT